MAMCCPNCGATVQLPEVGCPFVCGCGIRYTATLDERAMLQRLERLTREVADLRKAKTP